MFYIQDSHFSQSLTAHEAILTAATSSRNDTRNHGAGVFAFATSGGVSLIFEDLILSDFLSKSPFTLIVGVDDVTNTYTLKKLCELRDLYCPNFVVKVFCHNDPKSIFHPKFVWFYVDGEIRLITGSGNLTEKGLRRNWEAFTISRLSGDEIEYFKNYWDSWIKENEGNLYDVDDEEVARQAAKNNARVVAAGKSEVEPEGEEEVGSADDDVLAPERISQNGANRIESPSEVAVRKPLETEDYEAWTIEDHFEVLIAEIPNNGYRWKQANFNAGTFKGFFGGIAGGNVERRILLRHVNMTGKLEDIEVRPTVSVKSKNYRVELNAAAGLDYPNGEERPIGVFVKVSTRSFLYSLLMPDDVNYHEVLNYLDSSQPRIGNWMRRYLTNVEKLKENCPSLGFWRM